MKQDWYKIVRGRHWWTPEYLQNPYVKKIIDDFSEKQSMGSLIGAIRIWKFGPSEILAYREAINNADLPF